MKAGDLVNGYKILNNFSTAGGGLSKWSFAEKGGSQYFIKEFLSPVYPLPDSPGSSETKLRKKARCDSFEKHQIRILTALNSKCAPGGNLVFAHDFFRWGSKYYKITDRIDVAKIETDTISRLSIKQRLLILKTVTHSICILHNLGIVHGDIKPANILIKRSSYDSNCFISKLIDFDCSYFSGAPPHQDEAAGDLTYYSPEFSVYLRQPQKSNASNLTVKSDIYSLGLLFAQYLSGRLPTYGDAFRYAHQASLANNPLHMKSAGLPEQLHKLVYSMLDLQPSSRPSASHIFLTLKHIDKDIDHTSLSQPPMVERLKGSLVAKNTQISRLSKASAKAMESTDSLGIPEENSKKSRLRGKLHKKSK